MYSGDRDLHGVCLTDIKQTPIFGFMYIFVRQISMFVVCVCMLCGLVVLVARSSSRICIRLAGVFVKPGRAIGDADGWCIILGVDLPLLQYIP